ncbi:MAG: peptide deformylase [Clostridia bacterium]|nr:peptide deformylase [Clostridia bacterium]
MAIRNIVQVGDDVLRKKSAEVTEFDSKLWALLDDMAETLKKAQGAGLAGVQVGVLKRIFIVDYNDTIVEFINPKKIYESGTQIGQEGCLSVKGKYGTVTRPAKVVMEAQDRNGEKFRFNAKGFMAKCLCHEYDHLDGILYIDKATGVYEDK